MNQKTFRAPMELKADSEQGEFRAVFATLNVVDHDGDITEPGAFKDGQGVVIEGWNHDYRLPVGKGVIHADDEKAWVDGQFLLETASGRDHYEAVKALQDIAEWSYTFNIEESSADTREGERVRALKKLDVWGVAPVTRGAGIGTHTERIKASKRGDGDDDRTSTEGDVGNDKPSGKVQIAATRIALDILEFGE
jgi:HK97 family phage prohead protease